MGARGQNRPGTGGQIRSERMGWSLCDGDIDH